MSGATWTRCTALLKCDVSQFEKLPECRAGSVEGDPGTLMMASSSVYLINMSILCAVGLYRDDIRSYWDYIGLYEQCREAFQHSLLCSAGGFFHGLVWKLHIQTL